MSFIIYENLIIYYDDEFFEENLPKFWIIFIILNLWIKNGRSNRKNLLKCLIIKLWGKLRYPPLKIFYNTMQFISCQQLLGVKTIFVHNKSSKLHSIVSMKTISAQLKSNVKFP